MILGIHVPIRNGFTAALRAAEGLGEGEGFGLGDGEGAGEGGGDGLGFAAGVVRGGVVFGVGDDPPPHATATTTRDRIRNASRNQGTFGFIY